MINRKRSRSGRSNKQKSQFNEPLERRIMLAAQAVGTVPAQSLTIGTTPAAINLSTYLDDSVIPAGDTVVEVQTSLPAPNDEFPMILTNAATPKTVANFLGYIANGEYTNQIIHRSIPGFIIQGGGFNTAGGSLVPGAAIEGESATATLKNTTGTIAMALSTGPNSGTNEWFYNLADNPELDDTSDGGPFTAFGEVIYNGLTAIDAIAAVPVYNASSSNGAWSNLPLQNYNSDSGSFDSSNFVSISMVVDNNPLIYSVTSSNDTKVTAAIANGSLQLTPVAAGTATITVTATDLGGGTATQTIPVTVSAPGLPAVSVGPASGTIGTDSQITFPVTLSAAASTAVDVEYATVAGTAATGDYTATAGTLTIPAGATSATISVPILRDSADAAETFTLRLSDISANAGFSGGGISLLATGTINPAPTAATVASLLVPVTSLVPGGSTTLTASVTTTAGTPVTAGSVAFIENGTTVATVPVNGSGGAAYTQTFTTTGNLAVTAEYTGVTQDFAASTSTPATLAVTTLTPVTGKSTVPATIVAGNAASGSTVVTVTNSLTTPAKGTITVDVYASTTGILDGSAVLVGTAKKAVKLAAGGSAAVGVPVKIKAGTLPAGTYTLLSQTVDTAANLSTAVTGPALTVAPAVVTFTAAVTRLTTPATAVVAGAKTKAAAVVNIANGGNVPSTSPVTISLYASADGTVADGTLIRTVPFKVAIKQGKSASITVPLSAYPSVADGTYSIVAAITDGAGHTATAVSGSAVAIDAAFVQLAATKTAGPRTAVAGKSATVTVSFVNNGNVNATGSVPMAVSLSATADGANPISLGTVLVKTDVAPGKAGTAKFAVPVPTGIAPGTYYIVTTVDSTNALGEPSLADNTVVSLVTVTLT
jgi:cyclophilin family peptidyl-prolyl cis-trans isomerase